MERLFSRSTRYQDIAESHGGRLGAFRARRLHELNLDVSIEELVSAERAFTYGDLYAILGNKDTVAWLTPHAAVTLRDDIVEYSWPCCFCFNADDNKGIVAFSRSAEHLMEICDVVLRLLAASDVYSVNIDKCCCSDVAMINAVSLAYLLEQCQSLNSLTLIDQTLDENHCLAFDEYSRPGLEIELIRCDFTSAGSSALAEVLTRSQGLTKLHYCDIDNSFLANGLRGNSRLKSLTPQICGLLHACKRDVLAIADALKENKGLVELNLSYELNLIYGCFRENDETWGAICDSLKTHPTLEVLNLSRSELTAATNTPEAMKSRVQALLDMMRMNQLIHTIRLNDLHSRHELFQGSVIPYLETNRLRPRLLAIQKTRPILYRAKVLGRALLSARTNANSFWMLLSGNAEVAFPSKAATANLPRLATDTATVSASATAVAALSPTAGATSTISVSDVDSVATPTIIRKRKARP
jgi:hypothetical protein